MPWRFCERQKLSGDRTIPTSLEDVQGFRGDAHLSDLEAQQHGLRNEARRQNDFVEYDSQANKSHRKPSIDNHPYFGEVVGSNDKAKKAKKKAKKKHNKIGKIADRTFHSTDSIPSSSKPSYQDKLIQLELAAPVMEGALYPSSRGHVSVLNASSSTDMTMLLNEEDYNSSTPRTLISSDGMGESKLHQRRSNLNADLDKTPLRISFRLPNSDDDDAPWSTQKRQRRRRVSAKEHRPPRNRELGGERQFTNMEGIALGSLFSNSNATSMNDFIDKESKMRFTLRQPVQNLVESKYMTSSKDNNDLAGNLFPNDRAISIRDVNQVAMALEGPGPPRSLHQPLGRNIGNFGSQECTPVLGPVLPSPNGTKSGAFGSRFHRILTRTPTMQSDASEMTNEQLRQQYLARINKNMILGNSNFLPRTIRDDAHASNYNSVSSHLPMYQTNVHASFYPEDDPRAFGALDEMSSQDYAYDLSYSDSYSMSLQENQMVENLFDLLLEADSQEFLDTEKIDIRRMLRHRKKRDRTSADSVKSIQSVMSTGITELMQKSHREFDNTRNKCICWTNKQSAWGKLSLAMLMYIVASVSGLLSFGLFIGGVIGPMGWDEVGMLLLASFYFCISIATGLAVFLKSILWLELLGVGLNVTLISIILFFVADWYTWYPLIMYGEPVYHQTWPEPYTETGTWIEAVPWNPDAWTMAQMVLVSFFSFSGTVFICFLFGAQRSINMVFRCGGDGFEHMNYVQILELIEQLELDEGPLMDIRERLSVEEDRGKFTNDIT